MNDHADKIAYIETMRPLIGDSAADAAIAALRKEHTTQRVEASDGGRVSGVAQIRGDHAQVTINPERPDHVIEGRERALIDYLTGLQGECSPLQLTRIEPSESRYRQPMRLEQVYISLQTTTQVDEIVDVNTIPTNAQRKSIDVQERRTSYIPDESTRKRALSVIEVLSRRQASRLMLLGAPGSGKSTFVNHLVLCLAGAALSERGVIGPQPTKWLVQLDRWRLGALLPVRVILRDFAAYTPLAEAKQGTLGLLLDFLSQTLGPNADALEPLRAALTKGLAILVYDGLDEVVGEPVLSRVVESITHTTNTYARCPVVVTCRVLDYQANPRRQLSGFEVSTLASLTNEQISRFVEAWYDELAISGRKMLGNAEALRSAIASRTELRSLAELPLLLTMMAVVHSGKGRLPDARALLYDECIELLLLRWRQEPGKSDVLDMLKLPQFRASDLLALMARIGFSAHESASRSPGQEEQPASLRRAQVQRLLEEAFEPYCTGDPVRRDELVSLVLHSIAMRNGVLLKQSGEGGESYAFPHRTFQEFLAGYHLKGQRDYRRLCLDRSTQAHWHEALTLMVGYQVLADRELEKPLGLVEKLLDRTPAEQALGGELLVLIGRERVVNYDATLVGPGGLWRQARTVLSQLSTAPSERNAPITIRVRAALALGFLCYGDLETLCRVDTRIPLPDQRIPLAVVGAMNSVPQNWRHALETYWCKIDPGLFWHGGGNSDASLRMTNLNYSYKIAKYMITNADFARFIVAKGYDNSKWWTKNGWKQCIQIEKWERPDNWNSSLLNNPLQPVVGVSWYEAMAYCKWLTNNGHLSGWLSEKDVIRLPTSLEWERAARHIDKRMYPWGNQEPDIERANFDATALNRTTPIGCFPSGKSVCGALDLAGNTLEWMASSYETIEDPNLDVTPDDAVFLSDGAFWRPNDRMRCGARLRYSPLDRSRLQGFRVVCAPHSLKNR